MTRVGMTNTGAAESLVEDLEERENAFWGVVPPIGPGLGLGPVASDILPGILPPLY
jgi:hypothetical protein